MAAVDEPRVLTCRDVFLFPLFYVFFFCFFLYFLFLFLFFRFVDFAEVVSVVGIFLSSRFQTFQSQKRYHRCPQRIALQSFNCLNHNKLYNKVRRQRTRCFFFGLLNFQQDERDAEYQLLTT